MKTFRWVSLFALLAAALASLSVAATNRAAKIVPNHKHGRALFRANCGVCHTLKAGGTHGVTGPNLDKYRPPSLAYIKYQVSHGGGVMPAFTRFSPQDLADVAAFVWSRK